MINLKLYTGLIAFKDYHRLRKVVLETRKTWHKIAREESVIGRNWGETVWEKGGKNWMAGTVYIHGDDLKQRQKVSLIFKKTFLEQF